MTRGTVFNIQKFSIHDGPGVRTTVFLKGCPLSCKWCHNPESLSRNTQLVRYPERCTLCGNCAEVCPTGAFTMPSKDELVYDITKCDACGKCVDVCYYEALEIAGKTMTVEEVMNVIERDEVFYETSEGGVTFSGGEPLYQPDFLKELAKACKVKGYHVAVDTSGFTYWSNIEKIVNYVDLFLFDIKGVNNETHKKYVGVSNELILENLKKLDKKNVDIFIRMPLAKDINDSDEDIKLALDLFRNLKNIKQVNLLEYHSMGMEKYSRIGKEYELTGKEKPTPERIEAIKTMFEKENYKVVLGG